MPFNTRYLWTLAVLITGLQASLVSAQGSTRTQLNPKQVFEQYEALSEFSNVDTSEHCYLRAHHWARQLEAGFGTVSYKAFLLFTPIMQSERNIKWWYHVAPVVLMRDEDGNAVEMVMDKTLNHEPITLDEWVRGFSEEGCVTGKGFEEYDAQLFKGGCVVVRTPMYFFTPNDFRFPQPKSKWSCHDMVKVKEYTGRGDLMPAHCSAYR